MGSYPVKTIDHSSVKESMLIPFHVVCVCVCLCVYE